MTMLNAAAIARVLTDHFHLARPVDRRQVSAWASRRTLNRAGAPFPAPAGRRRARWARGEVPRYDVQDVIAWAEAGVPAPYGRGWLRLGPEVHHVTGPPNPGKFTRNAQDNATVDTGVRTAGPPQGDGQVDHVLREPDQGRDTRDAGRRPGHDRDPETGQQAAG